MELKDSGLDYKQPSNFLWSEKNWGRTMASHETSIGATLQPHNGSTRTYGRFEFPLAQQMGKKPRSQERKGQ